MAGDANTTTVLLDRLRIPARSSRPEKKAGASKTAAEASKAELIAPLAAVNAATPLNRACQRSAKSEKNASPPNKETALKFAPTSLKNA